MRNKSGATSLASGGAASQREESADVLLEAAIRQKTAKLGVIGLGYVGLPLIRTFVAAGFQTLGFDVDAEKVKSLQAGRSYIEHIPSEWIGRYVSSGSLRPRPTWSGWRKPTPC